MKVILKYISLFFIISLNHLVIAQTTILPDVIVLASPIVEDVKIDSNAAVSTVVSRNQIFDLNALDLASALRRTPGVQIARYNPVGSFGGGQGGAVFIRGMGLSRPGSEIKTFIDGIPFYMGLWNHPLLDLLPINGIRNITVHKSPQPHIEGNNFAFINLQTLNLGSDTGEIEGSIRISSGSFGTFAEQANFHGKINKVYFNISQGFTRSNGHRENSSGRLSNFIGSFGYVLNKYVRLEGKFIYVDNKAQDPGDARNGYVAIAPQYNTRASLFSLGVLHKYSKFTGELKFFANQGKGAWLNQPPPDGSTISNFSMSGIRWKEHIQVWSNTKLSFGVDYDILDGSADFNRIAPASASKYESNTFKILSPYIFFNQNIFLSEKLLLRPSVGIRYYFHNSFETSLAPSFGLSLEGKKISLFANLSRGINYPGLETPLLSSLIPLLANSWRQLNPEEMNHIELGLKGSIFSNSQFFLSVFQDAVMNRYIFGFPPNVPPPPQFINLGGYKIQGLEVSFNQTLFKRWQSFLGICLLKPSIKNLPYTPETAITLGINGKIKRFGIFFDGQYQSDLTALNRSRIAGDVNRERIDDFVVINAKFSYHLPCFGSQGEVFANIENILNKSYYFRPGYIMPGRWGQLGISINFKKFT